HWGFQFYAERAGMKPVAPYQSHLLAGDWLVVPDQRIEQQRVAIDPGTLEWKGSIVVQDNLPLRTVRGFYGGHAPLEHQEGPRLTVQIYRISKSFTALWQPPVKSGTN